MLKPSMMTGVSGLMMSCVCVCVQCGVMWCVCVCTMWYDVVCLCVCNMVTRRVFVFV